MQKFFTLFPALLGLLATTQSTVGGADPYSMSGRSSGYLSARKGDVEKFRKTVDVGKGKGKGSYYYKGG